MNLLSYYEMCQTLHYCYCNFFWLFEKLQFTQNVSEILIWHSVEIQEFSSLFDFSRWENLSAFNKLHAGKKPSTKQSSSSILFTKKKYFQQKSCKFFTLCWCSSSSSTTWHFRNVSHKVTKVARKNIKVWYFIKFFVKFCDRVANINTLKTEFLLYEHY